MWTAAAFIARKDLTYMLRQKETILWVFAMPILFFYFIGTVTAGFGNPAGSAERPDPLALRAPAASGFLVDEVIRRLEEQRFRVVRPATPDEFDGYARRLTVPAPPAGHESVTDAVIAGQDLVLTFERRGDPLAATFDRVRVSRAVYTVLADLTVVKNSGETPTAAAIRRRGSPRRSPARWSCSPCSCC